jgi:hypothetical protein
MMMKRFVLFLLFIAVVGIGVWAGFRSGALKWYRQATGLSNLQNSTSNDPWAEAIEKVKADRGEPMGANAPVEVPPELKHYEDRHWFLATQVAEVGKYNVQTCQDFVDLAGMIERGEMVTLPAVTNTYVLYGVGEEAEDGPFSRYLKDTEGVAETPAVTGRSVNLYGEAQLAGAYKQLDEKRLNLEKEIADLKTQSGALKKSEREKQKELQTQISEKQQELNAINGERTALNRSYGLTDGRQDKRAGKSALSKELLIPKEDLFRDYERLQMLAKNFAGRSFDIQIPNDRQAMKVAMLSSLRPEALKILEEVALAYHRQFDRPLPVSSLVRPEEYQHALRRVNRNAVVIETPPHSTGLAFDIDYRYMSAAEQTFLMAELARLKTDGRIEVIRERNANYHVFAFINGMRPSDELITASLEKAGAEPVQETHHAAAKQKTEVRGQKSAVRSRSKTQKSRALKSRTRRRR